MQSTDINVNFKSDREGDLTSYRHTGVKSISLLNHDGQEITIPMGVIKEAFTAGMGECTFVGDPDPWKHRSSGMKCRTCMWFILKNKGITPREEINSQAIGRCRRHAPTMNGYPVVFEDDWCGDHKLDETKV